MHVKIVIVTYRNPEDVVACLGSLAEMNHTNFAVHICENGGMAAQTELAAALMKGHVASPVSDGEGSMWQGTLKSGQEVRISVEPSNPGYAGGVNSVLRAIATKSDWQAVWVLNADTAVDPGALGALVAHSKSGNYGITGSRLINKNTGRVQLYGGRWRKWMARGFNIGLNEPADAKPSVEAIEGAMDYVSGASMLVTRTYVETIGLMTEEFFLYGEDVEWCLRRGAFALGYAHNSIVYHSVGGAIGSNQNRKMRTRLSVYLDERSKLMVTRQKYPDIYPIVAVITLLLNSQYLVAGSWRNFFYAIEGWWAGVRGETGKPYWLKPAAENG